MISKRRSAIWEAMLDHKGGWQMAEGFEGLLVWQKAHALMLFVHRKIVPCLPREEKWDLAQQMRRSSKSVGANIAEGHGRYYYRDRVRFCYNARGSLGETENHLRVARDLGYISDSTYRRGCEAASEVQRLLNGYIDYLKREQPGRDEPGHNIHVDHLLPDPDDPISRSPVQLITEQPIADP